MPGGALMLVAMIASSTNSFRGRDDPAPATPVASGSLKPGDQAVLGLQGGGRKLVWLARSEADWDAMLDAENAISKDLLALMIAQGRMPMVPTGTPVVIEKRATFTAFVQIISANSMASPAGFKWRCFGRIRSTARVENQQEEYL